MQYGFDTDDQDHATAALLVYAIWRSRDWKRYKITPDTWERVERFVKASAKRADSVPRFIEALKPKLMCGTLSPRAMEVGIKGLTQVGGAYVQRAESREFLTGVLQSCTPTRVLESLYRETAYIVLLVRDRLEREKPFEDKLEIPIAEAEEL